MATPSRPGSRPGTVYGLMPWLSRRSMRREPTSTAMPRAVQPMASLKSERGGSSSDPPPECELIPLRSSGLGDADGVGRHLRLATRVQVPRIHLHRGPHGLLRFLAVQ